jgi:hypothetical protein
MTNIRDRRGDITSDATDSQRIRESYGQFYANRFNNVDKTISLNDTNYQSSLRRK